MRILFCLAGQRVEEQWAKAARLVDFRAHEVAILHVVDESLVPAADAAQRRGLPRGLRPEREAEMQRALDQAGQEVIARALAVAREAGVEAQGILRSGHPPAVILETARQFGAEALILGRQHPGLEGRILGGVSRFVVDQAPCTVLLLR